MSLITQCPACATLFKVVPDQLRVSDGWVRCGQCDEVFDANAHLQTTLQEARQSTFGDSYLPSAPARSRFAPEDPPPAPHATTGVHTESDPSEEASGVLPSAVLAHQDDASSAPSGASLGSPMDAIESAMESNAQTESETEAAVRAEYEALLRSVEVDSDLPSGFEHEHEHEHEHAWVPDEELAPHGQAPSGDEWADAIGEPVLSFMQVKPVVEVVSRPWVRPTLFALSAVLSLAWVLQVIVHERDWIAAKAPAVAPGLIGLCEVVGCQVSALREIESVVIDSSSFVKVRTDVYRVHLTLKNTAIHPVATPALELTLTNVHDQPIARRIILPREFGMGQGPMAPGAELLATVAIRAKLSTDTEPISGYRLLVFYP